MANFDLANILQGLGAALVSGADPRAGQQAINRITEGNERRAMEQRLSQVVQGLPEEVITAFGGDRNSVLEALRTGAFSQLSPHVLEAGRQRREERMAGLFNAGKAGEPRPENLTAAETMQFNSGVEAGRDEAFELSGQISQAQNDGVRGVLEAASSKDLSEIFSRADLETSNAQRLFGNYPEILSEVTNAIRTTAIDQASTITADSAIAAIQDRGPNVVGEFLLHNGQPVQLNSNDRARVSDAIREARRDTTRRLASLQAMLGSIPGTEVTDPNDPEALANAQAALTSRLPEEDREMALLGLNASGPDDVYANEQLNDWLRSRDPKELRAVAEDRASRIIAKTGFDQTLQAITGPDEAMRGVVADMPTESADQRAAVVGQVIAEYRQRMASGQPVAENHQALNGLRALAAHMKDTDLESTLLDLHAEATKTFIRDLPENVLDDVQTSGIVGMMPDLAAVSDVFSEPYFPTYEEAQADLRRRFPGNSDDWYRTMAHEQMARSKNKRPTYADRRSKLIEAAPGDTARQQSVETLYDKEISDEQERRDIATTNAGLASTQAEQNTWLGQAKQIENEIALLQAGRTEAQSQLFAADIVAAVAPIIVLDEDEWPRAAQHLNRINNLDPFELAVSSGQSEFPAGWETMSPQKRLDWALRKVTGSLRKGSMKPMEVRAMRSQLAAFQEWSRTVVAPSLWDSHDEGRRRFRDLPEWSGAAEDIWGDSAFYNEAAAYLVAAEVYEAG